MSGKTRIPSLRRHSTRDQAFVEIHGRRRYLGPWGAEETQEAYRRVLAEWAATGHAQAPPPKEELTVIELVDRYLDHCERYYRGPKGLTSTLFTIRQAIRTVLSFYGRQPAAAFGPLAFQAVRQVWMDARLARTTINHYAQEVRRMFRWGVTQELVEPSVYQGLAAIPGLRKHRYDVREPEPVRAVGDSEIEAVLSRLEGPVRTAAVLQLLTAARPGEILQLTPAMVDTSGAVWKARLTDHKTAWRDLDRTLYFGPRAQALLRPLLLRPPDVPLFDPHEVARRRKGPGRRPGQPASPRSTERVVGDHYTTASYRRALTRASESAGVTPYVTPHRLRHTAATRIRAAFGLEAAQVLLGHSTADVT